MRYKDWFYEQQTENQRIGFRIKETIYSGYSKYQKIDVYETEEQGRMLTLDDLIMVSEKFEFVYHEMLTHIPLCVHTNPEKVLVIGGGDGGTVREILKHDEVKKAVLCEIDKEVIDKSKEYLPFTSSQLDNPKVDIRIQDGFKYLKDNKSKFDIILVDSTDPVGEGAKLFEKDFYQLCHDALSEDGMLVFQSESPFLHKDLIKDVFHQRLEQLFDISSLYLSFIPDYPMGMWSFGVGSKKYHPKNDLITEKADKIAKNTRYYNKDIHKACFALPNFVKELVD
jgi:spermidine synthase